MTSNAAYYKFLLKINKNGTQGNITCDVATFVLLFNESQRKWLNRNVPENDSEDIANVQSIIISTILKPFKVSKEYVEYSLPKDWFANSDSYVLASKGDCKNQKVNLRQIRSILVRDYMFDEANQPSVEYEWSFFTVEGDKVKVFKKDFTLSDLYFSYYKEPREIDIQGYVRLDGEISTTIDPELADIFVDQIISETATEYMRNYQNQIGLSFSKDRQNSENN